MLRALKNCLKENPDASQNQLQVDCLDWAIAQLSTECKWISHSVNHTKEKTQSQQAHAKLTKEQRQEAAHQMAIARKSSASSSVQDKLLNVWNTAKNAISTAPAKEADLSSQPKVKRLRFQNNATSLNELPPLSERISNINTGIQKNAASSDKSVSMQLPPPADRIWNMYTPAEAVKVFMHADAEKENLCQKNKEQCAHMRYPTICRYSYTEKSIVDSFVKMGMILHPTCRVYQLLSILQ